MGAVAAAAKVGASLLFKKACETPRVGPQYNAANTLRCTAPQKAMFSGIVALVIVGGLATGLLRHAMVQMGANDPMESDNFWVRAPATTAYMACLFTGGYLVYLLVQVLIRVLLG